MSARAQPWMVLMAFGAALALSIGESQRAFAVNRRLGTGLLLRRTLLRTLALGLVAVGLAELVSWAAALVWHDLDLFLLRHEKLDAAGPSWHAAWCKLAGGLLLCAATLPRPVAALLGGLVGWCTALVGWGTLRCLPLQLGHDQRLVRLVGAIVLAGALGVGASCLRARAADDSRPERQLWWWVGGSAVGLWAASWLWLAPTGEPFVRALVAGGVALAVSAQLASVAYRVLRLAGEPQRRWLAFERLWVGGLSRYQPGAWLLLAGLVGVWHWAVVFVALPAAEHTNRHAALDRMTAWPQVLTGREHPQTADWNRVAHRLRGTVGRYRPHPWCGRYLLLVAWVEASRLDHEHRARSLLHEASEIWPRVRATAPPGWPAAGTVGGIARAVLARWGQLVEPGARPA